MSVVIIQEGFYSMRYKNGERGSHSDFFVALIRRAVAIVALRKRDVPVPQSPLLTMIPGGLMVVPPFLGD